MPMSSHGRGDKGGVLMAVVQRLTKGKRDSRFPKKASLNHKAVKVSSLSYRDSRTQRGRYTDGLTSGPWG